MDNNKIIPIEPHTGGVLDPSQIIGRESVIKKYWEILKRQGIVLYAERRLGKSAVLSKMHHAKNKTEFLTIYKGVEGVASAENFVDEFYEHVKRKGLIEESTLKKVKKFYNSITSYVDEIKGFKFKKN